MGVTYCRTHGLPMRLETMSDRAGLGCCRASRPRDPVPPSLRLHDIRHHHLAGRARDFALRHALQTCAKSSVEVAHGSLQLGCRQGLKDVAGKEGSRCPPAVRLHGGSVADEVWLEHNYTECLALDNADEPGVIVFDRREG